MTETEKLHKALRRSIREKLKRKRALLEEVLKMYDDKKYSWNEVVIAERETRAQICLLQNLLDETNSDE